MNCPKCNTPNPDGQKFCGNCGAELPQKKEREFHGYSFTPDGKPIQHKENFTYTQNQPIQIKKKKKHGCLTAILSAFGLFFLFILVVLIVPDSDDSSKDTSNQATASQKAGKKTEETSKKDDIKVGSTFEIKGLKITINDANTNFTDWGQYDSAPADGMKYIMVNFTFENTKTSGDKYVSIYDFDCYADDSTCDQVYLSDDSDFMNTNLSPGRNVTFSTYYTVPENASSIELEYHENMIGDAKTKIIIQ